MQLFEHHPFSDSDPHASQGVLRSDLDIESAEGIVIMVHGRGGSARNTLALFTEISVEGVVALAPQAADHSWYPHSFLAPIEMNEPWLSSALRRLGSLVSSITDLGIPTERTAIFGFSQGACLAIEFAARNPAHYGAVMGLTGGLIGPPGTIREYAGSLMGTKVFLGTGDPDPHVPLDRVHETRDVLSGMGAEVELRVYPGMSHSINQQEFDICRGLLGKILEDRE